METRTAVAERIPGIVKEATGWPEVTDSFPLQPLKSIRYFDTEMPNRIGPRGNPTNLALSAILAVVILTIAGVNYVNLAVARLVRVGGFTRSACARPSAPIPASFRQLLSSRY